MPEPAAPTSTVTFLTWNILHGGGPTRLPEIVLALLSHKADVVALNEFRGTRGSSIRAALTDHGLTHQTVTPNASGNGILIASRFPIVTDRPAMLTPWGRGRWLEARIPALNMDVLAVHVPDDTMRTEKSAFWQEVLSWARARRMTPAIIMGDVNTGRRGRDIPFGDRGWGWGSASGCEALLGTLLSLGFCDAWRAKHPESREGSWSRSAEPAEDGAAFEADGLRIDAAYVSGVLRESLISAEFSQAERARRLSDHAPLVVRVAMKSEKDRGATGAGGSQSSGMAGFTGLFAHKEEEPDSRDRATGV